MSWRCPWEFMVAMVPMSAMSAKVKRNVVEVMVIAMILAAPGEPQSLGGTQRIAVTGVVTDNGICKQEETT